MRIQSPSAFFVSSILSLAAFTVVPAVSVGCGSSGSEASPPAASAPDSGRDTVVLPPPKADAGVGVDSSVVDAAAASPFGNGAPSNVYPAPHPSAPIVVNDGAGQTMKAMKIIPVFFPHEPYQTQLADFVSTLGATDYWKSVTDEYGVGAASAGTPVVLLEDAATAITDDQIQAFITAHAGTDAAWGTPDANTLYVLFYPSTTKITLGSDASCSTFGGYHSNTKLNGQNLAYAVIPRCSGFGAAKGVAAVTGPTSHELVEAATDPFPMDNPAFTSVSTAQYAWALALGGSEVSDLCAQSSTAFFTPTPYAYRVQRSWSNLAAAASHDPCVPAVAGPYFNSAVVLPDSANLDPSGSTQVVKIAVGKSKTVEIDLFSDAPTNGPWGVKAIDVDSFSGGATNLDLALDRASGVNGEKVNLTITVNGKGQYGLERFLIVSSLDGVQTFWAGMVSN